VGIVLYRKMVEGEILLTIRKDGQSTEQTYTKIGWGIDPSKGCVLMSHDFIVQSSGSLAFPGPPLVHRQCGGPGET